MSDEQFDDFWKATLETWKKTPLKERNFLKRIGLEPNKETSQEAYNAIKSSEPQQFSLFTGCEKNEKNN